MRSLATAVRYPMEVLWPSAKIALFAATCASILSACPAKRPAPVLPEAPVAAIDPLDADLLYADVQRLCAADLSGRGSYQEGGKRASSFVYKEFAKLGYRVFRQPVRAPYAENIIALKEGDGRAVIVSAHHDHLGFKNGEVYLGADDNASGLAVLLGMARTSAAMEFEHTVMFVSFGAEEDGLVGSSVYIRDPFWPLSKTEAVINFDMVGRNFFEAGADQESAAAVVGLEASPMAARIVEQVARRVGLKAIMVPARLLELFGLHDRTDDWWFRRQGIASFHFSTGLHDDYHQVTDTVEKIVPEQMSRVARTAQALLAAVAGARPPKEALLRQ